MSEVNPSQMLVRDNWTLKKLLQESELVNAQAKTDQSAVSANEASTNRIRPKDVIDLIPVFSPGKFMSLTAPMGLKKVEGISKYRLHLS